MCLSWEVYYTALGKILPHPPLTAVKDEPTEPSELPFALPRVMFTCSGWWCVGCAPVLASTHPTSYTSIPWHLVAKRSYCLKSTKYRSSITKMNIHKICNPIRISLSSVSISLGQSALIYNNQKLTCCLPESRIENSLYRRSSHVSVCSCIENFLEILIDAPSLPPSLPFLCCYLACSLPHCHVTKHNTSTGEGT